MDRFDGSPPPPTAHTDEQRVRALVAELDALVPRVENQVRVMDGGEGLDVVATRAGALRLGVAILRAAVEEAGPDTTRTDAEAELHALVDPDSDTWIEMVLIEHQLPALPPAADDGDSDARSAVRRFVGMVLLLGAVVVFCVWVAKVTEWILG